MSAGAAVHHESPRYEQSQGSFPLRRGRRLPRIAILLTLVLLIPVTSLAAVTGASAVSNWKARQAAAAVRADIAAPTALMQARALVVDEGLPSIALANAADSGVSPVVLERVTGVDFAAAARRARPLVTSNAALQKYPALAADLRTLKQLRVQLDKGTTGYATALAFFTGFTGHIDALWRSQLDALRRHLTSSGRATGSLTERLAVLPVTYSLLTTLVQRASDANNVLLGRQANTSLKALLASTGAARADTNVLSGHLGPAAEAAWKRLQSNPAMARFDAAVTQTVDLALAGRRSPLVAFPAARIRVFTDGSNALNDLEALVQGAATDVQQLARSQEATATRNLQIAVAVFALSLLFAVGAALLLTRAVVRPLRRLAEAARTVAAGDFTLPAVPPSGPREVAETIGAVDDLTAVLAAVESFTVTLASDPTSPELDVPLPGSTGLALQATLDRLRESVREAERQRVILHEVATHDDLTGLQNRAAALESVSFALARSRENAGTIMLLFIDLDGLKAINDTHGHKVGDEAIRLAALALRDATRASDVVARLGGDEFLVAGTLSPEQDDLRSLAERIHRAVAESALLVDELSIPLRCSIGIATSLPGDDVESLINKADQALYAAKRKGRNQISWHHQPTIPGARRSVDGDIRAY